MLEVEHERGRQGVAPLALDFFFFFLIFLTIVVGEPTLAPFRRRCIGVMKALLLIALIATVSAGVSAGARAFRPTTTATPPSLSVSGIF
jgi:hypothetical protein